MSGWESLNDKQDELMGKLDKLIGIVDKLKTVETTKQYSFDDSNLLWAHHLL